MNMPLNIVIQKHSELSEKQLNDIARLKDQHWPHGLESQKAWIANNFEEDDIHLILYSEDTAVAYASMNHICCTVDAVEEAVLGLGGVCVDKANQKQGLGRKIVEYANQYITTAGKIGLLLCHQALIGFYSLYGWKTVEFGKATVAEAPFEHFVMSFGKQYGRVQTLAIPKNF